jgi:hypothetical protein
VSGSPLLGRASKVCYVYGFWTFVVVLLNVTLYSAVFTPEVSQLVSLFVLVTMLPLALLFGFYTFKVGDDYDIHELIEAGVLCVVSEVVSLILLSPAFLGGGFFFFYGVLSFFDTLIYFVAFLLLFVAILFPILFIVGVSRMREETGLGEFGRAMAFALGGFIIPGLFGLAVIQFGVALSSLVKIQEAP